MSVGGGTDRRLGGWAVRRIVAQAMITLLTAYPSNRLAAQCPDGSPPPCARPASPRSAGDPMPSLTVLYLENASPDTGDVTLADGITEEVITRLSQVPGVRVTSRYAALRYRGRRMLDPQIGRAHV